MTHSIPDDLFYDPEVVGATVLGPPGRPKEEAVQDEAFYSRPGDATRGNLPILLWRIAAKEYRLAGVLFLFGFFTVFVNQAPLVYQIVLGAPIFEEFLKFGLAMLIAIPLRAMALRLPVAFAVGAGFGVLEHYVTYPDESTVQFYGRIAFHGGATALSLIAYHAVAVLPDVRSRFLATLPATLIHFANNFLAVLTLALIPAGLDVVEFVGTAISTVMIILLYVGIIWLLADPVSWRGWAARRSANWFRQRQGSDGGRVAWEAVGAPPAGGPAGASSQAPEPPEGGPDDNWPMRRS